jgi:O-antigen ligase
LDFEGRLRGVSAHKNALGSFAAITFLVGAAQLGLSRTSKLAFAGSLLILPLSLICMAWAHSTAVIPVIAAAIGILGVGRVLRRSSRGLLAILPVSVCIAILAVLLAAEHSGDLAEMMGKDPDISGRTLVWDFALSRALASPVVGYGFGAFWVGGNSPGAVFWSNTHLGVPHAHNGYIQLVLETGTIGLGLFCIAAVTVILRVVWLMRHSRGELSVWPLGFIAFFLVSNLSETWLWLGNELLPLLFVYVVVRTNADFLAIKSLRQIASAAEWNFLRCVPSEGVGL